MQRQRGALHRHPAPVLHHRPGRVDAQRHRGAGALLGLDDLHVGDVEQPRASPPAWRSWALSSVRGTFHASVSPNAHGRVAPVASADAPDRCVSRSPRRAPIRSTTSRSADSPSRRSAFGDSRSDPSGARSNRPWRSQLALQLGQRAGVDPGLVAELLAERVEVDVLHPRARVALRELLGQRVELPELLHRPGGLAHAERVVAAEPAAARPSPRRAAGPAAGRRAGPAPEPAAGRRRPAGTAPSARPAARRVIELSIRWAAAARCASRSTSSSVLRGFSGKNSPCCGHELVELRGGVLPGGVVREQVG